MVSESVGKEHYSDNEIAQRRDEALRRALNMPPQPKHGKVRESNPTKANRSPAIRASATSEQTPS
jgi:hypothetical protein